MQIAITYLWVAIGGALGSMARYAIATATADLAGGLFPWGTFGINISGSFLIGLFFELTAANGALPASADMRLFLMAGLCGGFTTFSAFSLQALQLLKGGDYAQAAGYMVGSVALCVIATALGFWVAARFGLSPVPPGA
jgi:CrcB protein